MTLKLDQVFICTGFWKLYQGVSIGGGIGSISDILDASQMIIEKNVCILTPAFIFSLKILFVFENISLYTLVTGKWLEFFSNAIRSNC